MVSRVLYLTLVFATSSALADTKPQVIEVPGRAKLVKKSELYYEKLGKPEAYDSARESFLHRERMRLMTSLRRLMHRHTTSDQKAEIGLRLAKTYLEEYYGEVARIPTKTGRETASSAGISKTADKFLHRARTLYAELAHLFPHHPRRDEMLYFIGMSHFDEGRYRDGIATFRELTTAYPKSRFVDDAATLVADHDFNDNHYAQAEKGYDQIIQRHRLPLLPYSLYKKAWCRYNQGDAKGALTFFTEAVRVEGAHPSAGGMRVRNEVAKDIAYPYVDLGQSDRAVTFYEGLGDPYLRPGLETVATLCRDRGDYKKAVHVWEELLSLDSDFSKNPSYELEIINALMLANRGKDALDRLEEASDRYLGESSWAKKHEKDAQLVAETRAAWEAELRKYALTYHAEAQKMKNRTLYGTARRLYGRYLELFPQAAFAPQARFNLAEILSHDGKDEAAAEAYFAAYRTFSATGPREESLRLAVASLLGAINRERMHDRLDLVSAQSQNRMKQGAHETQPYAKVETRFFELVAEYRKAFPKSKASTEMAYEQAYLRYLHFDLEIAQKSFESLITASPTHPTARAAAYLVLDILNRRGSYDELIAGCQRFLGMPTLTRTPGFRAEVSRVLREAELKRVALLDSKGEFEKAARGYLRYARLYGSQDRALLETALYNAAGNFTKANLAREAAETQDQFLRLFPESRLRRDLILALAKGNEAMAKFYRSARYFAQFAEEFPTHSAAPQALRLAGLYYWASGHPRLARKAFHTYLDHYKSQATQVEGDLLALSEASGDRGALMGYYSEAKKDPTRSPARHVLAALKLAELKAQRHGRLSESLMAETLDYAKHHPTALKKEKGGAEALALLEFWGARQKSREFERTRVSERTLSRKLALLKELEKNYAKVVKLGGEWGLAAIYETAEAYHQTAQAIDAAPAPRGLAAAQLDKYRAEVKRSLTGPLLTKAGGMAGSCLDKARDFRLSTVWSARCYSLASTLQPEKFPLRRTAYLPPLQAAVVLPDEGSRIARGKDERWSFPYDSPLLFTFLPPERHAATLSELVAPEGVEDPTNEKLLPQKETYQALAQKRREVLNRELEATRPAAGAPPTFAYLNLLRLSAPMRAVPAILKALETDAGNPALINLLGLAYFDSGEWPAAKVTWLSLLASGKLKGPAQNNLALIALQEGKHELASELLLEVTRSKQPLFEAYMNLGMLALKSFNGEEASHLFDQALSLDDKDASARVARAEAAQQRFYDDEAKSALGPLAEEGSDDPYVTLALAYHLLDVEKNNVGAKQLISTFLQKHTVAAGDPLRRALREAGESLTGESRVPAAESEPGGERAFAPARGGAEN